MCHRAQYQIWCGHGWELKLGLEQLTRPTNICDMPVPRNVHNEVVVNPRRLQSLVHSLPIKVARLLLHFLKPPKQEAQRMGGTFELIPNRLQILVPHFVDVSLQEFCWSKRDMNPWIWSNDRSLRTGKSDRITPHILVVGDSDSRRWAYSHGCSDKKHYFMSKLQSITLFRSMTMFYGTGNILWNISYIKT